jgi:glutaredoxin
MRARAISVLLGLSLSFAVVGCKRSEPSPGGPDASSSAPAPSGAAPFSFSDDSQGLFITWVDPEGDFHVTQKTSDVPGEARKLVRVVLQSQPAGSLDFVYVTDLDQKGPGGRYSVRLLERGKWDEIGAARRKERMDKLSPPAPSVSPTGPLAAVIYGAEWCKPCHMAEAYLKERGLNVTKKDIEESDESRAEMQAKLVRSGLGGAQIPVIDVAGTLLVGFSAPALDAAIRRAEEARKAAPAPAASVSK